MRASATRAAPSTTCSQLSITSSVRWAARSVRIADRGSLVPVVPIATATALSTSLESATSASGTNHTLENSPTSSAAAVHRQSGLADATHAGERHDPVLLAPSHTRSRRSASRPMNDDRCRGRLLVYGVDAPDRREPVRQRRMTNLPDPLGLGEVAQPMGAEVDEIDGIGSRADQRGRDVGQEDLSSVARAP